MLQSANLSKKPRSKILARMSGSQDRQQGLVGREQRHRRCSRAKTWPGCREPGQAARVWLGGSKNTGDAPERKLVQEAQEQEQTESALLFGQQVQTMLQSANLTNM